MSGRLQTYGVVENQDSDLHWPSGPFGHTDTYMLSTFKSLTDENDFAASQLQTRSRIDFNTVSAQDFPCKAKRPGNASYNRVDTFNLAGDFIERSER